LRIAGCDRATEGGRRPDLGLRCLQIINGLLGIMEQPEA
jgi:hypothetical protein